VKDKPHTPCFVSSNIFRQSILANNTSFIRQKHSNSRLLISRHLFESIVTKYKIFGKLEPILLSFGWKLRECDIGPPHCVFQVRDEAVSDGSDPLHLFSNFGESFL
jgi:hypothetical protein